VVRASTHEAAVKHSLEGHMADQELRDRNNRLLGKIKQLSNGKLEGRDASNRLKGTFDPSSNETRDQNNSLVGKGNMLAILIADSTR
jgi:hypothetical protein